MAHRYNPPLIISSTNSPSPSHSQFLLLYHSTKKTFPPLLPGPVLGRLHKPLFRCYSWRRGRYRTEEEDEDDDDDFSGPASATFQAAVDQFNRREYYECHDSLEALWMRAEDERSRTLFHGILQCAVGFHHLFNQNHKGAMMELGEGVCKLRKMNFERGGPFGRFEEEITAVLEFIYLTQLQLAACTEDMCVAMDQSETSYQLLGGYGAGEQIYSLGREWDDGSDGQVVGGGPTFLIFVAPTSGSGSGGDSIKVKLPTLEVTHEHLRAISR